MTWSGHGESCRGWQNTGLCVVGRTLFLYSFGRLNVALVEWGGGGGDGEEEDWVRVLSYYDLWDTKI